ALGLWGESDSGWYLDSATHGYSAALSTESSTAGQANFAFFPLYPLAMRGAGALFLGPFVGGLLVSIAALTVAAIALEALVRELFGEEDARWTVRLLFAW